MGLGRPQGVPPSVPDTQIVTSPVALLALTGGRARRMLAGVAIQRGPTMLRILRVFLDKPRDGLAGSDIWKETKILSGTLYPILMRLEKARWLESWWEEIDPGEAGRPRKRLYRLTGLGYNSARDALRDLGVPMGRRAWNW